MKRFVFLLLFVIGYCGLASANDPKSKTFLVLFKSKELKEIKTSIRDIETHFSEAFTTKYYTGNSELALLIEIPSCDFDACFLGEFLIETANGQKIQLQQIAFRLYDLTENRTLHRQYVTLFEESQLAKKKAAKAAKADSELRGAAGY